MGIPGYLTDRNIRLMRERQDLRHELSALEQSYAALRSDVDGLCDVIAGCGVEADLPDWLREEIARRR